MPEDVYTRNGYADREAYLRSLAEEYDIDHYIVKEAADLLGPSEDFDGLVSSLQDYTGD